MHHSFINSLFSSNFASDLKDADVLPTYKKEDKLRTIVQLVFSIRSLRSMKDVYMTKSISPLIKFFLNINVVFAKVYNTQHSLLGMVEKWEECLDKRSLGGRY